jgi:hypothetical protein
MNEPSAHLLPFGSVEFPEDSAVAFRYPFVLILAPKQTGCDASLWDVSDIAHVRKFRFRVPKLRGVETGFRHSKFLEWKVDSDNQLIAIAEDASLGAASKLIVVKYTNNTIVPVPPDARLAGWKGFFFGRGVLGVMYSRGFGEEEVLFCRYDAGLKQFGVLSRRVVKLTFLPPSHFHSVRVLAACVVNDSTLHVVYKSHLLVDCDSVTAAVSVAQMNLNTGAIVAHRTHSDPSLIRASECSFGGSIVEHADGFISVDPYSNSPNCVFVHVPSGDIFSVATPDKRRVSAYFRRFAVFLKDAQTPPAHSPLSAKSYSAQLLMQPLSRPELREQWRLITIPHPAIGCYAVGVALCFQAPGFVVFSDSCSGSLMWFKWTL